MVFQNMGWGLLFGGMVPAGIVCGVGGISKTMDGVCYIIIILLYRVFSYLEGVMWSCGIEILTLCRGGSCYYMYHTLVFLGE